METTKVFTKLFNKDGSLSLPVQFQKSGYTWSITLEFTEVHNVPAIDLKLKCDGIQDGIYLSMSIQIVNLTKEIFQQFEQVFDRQRNIFCYRRIVTGIRTVRKEDGKTITSFPINRFLLDDETGEHYDSMEQTKWTFYNPVTWNVLDDGRVEAKSFRKCYNKFEYVIVLKQIVVDENPIPINIPKWPKSNDFPVQIEFFEPVWPEVRKLLTKIRKKKMIIQERYLENIVDILGAYYHQWEFDEDKLLKLNRVAIKIGFIRFMDGIGIGGEFLRIINSKCASNIGKVARRKNTSVSHEAEFERYQRTWIVDRIPETTDPSSVFKIRLRNHLQWNVNFFLSNIYDQKNVSIGSVLVGDLRMNYECILEVSFNSRNGMNMIRRNVQRILNRTQKTCCIPIFCSIDELETNNEDGNSEYQFQITLDIRKTDESKEECNSEIEISGPNDVVLKLEGKRIAVNKRFLAHHVKFFAGMFFNENFNEYSKKEIEISTVSYKEMIHFLDVLYHGTKLFDVSQYYHVLRMADEWICEKVIRIIEKAIENSVCQSVNKKKLKIKFGLKIDPQASTNPVNLKRESINQCDIPPEIKKKRVEK